MSTVQTPINNVLDIRRSRSLHPIELFNSIIGEVSEVIAPVWPLQDYVAVNPYAGISHLSFMDARSFMKVFSDCETLMPLEHYASEFHRERFTLADIDSAIAEISATGHSLHFSAFQIAEKLAQCGAVGTSLDQPTAPPNSNRSIRTFAEIATSTAGIDWTETIVDEVSKHCAMHYDQGQSTWSSPYKDLTLYQAWRSAAEYDCNIEILGLKGFRTFVSGLPFMPEAAIVQLLNKLDVPVQLWTSFLLCQAFSIPGWSAWTKYQTDWTNADGTASNDLTGLLAIRLAYDAALAESKSLRSNWISLVDNETTSFPKTRTSPGGDSMVRYVLLRASEIAYRNQLVKSFTLSEEILTDTNERKLGQMVFCIDVRSERIRRHLESQSSDIETFGFAGFFGMAFEYAELGHCHGKSQLPVLLQPQFKLHEGFYKTSDSSLEIIAVEKRKRTQTWHRFWQSFQASAVGCFSFVETTGLLYGFKLLGRSIGYSSKLLDTQFDGRSKREHEPLGPTLRGLQKQGISTSRQADMAEGMLRNLGLTKGFAQLVVFCGHACQTDNNPLAAGLDCGACGGHSGEPNARFAALLLNQSSIRQVLAERGIEIPSDTHFLGALHNTTTDAIRFFDEDGVPAGLQAELKELKSSCEAATKQTQIERLPIVDSTSLKDLLKRAGDWSEVRPEWGLAGNAAFIVAPRSVTKNARLDARSFLHSYDYTQDEGGKVLETIMTAPMIVANWINMQYYASTVDNEHFGSGNKTVHNVVGGFGILSGNGGDLITGLPWQSLHTGDAYQHLPMRLQVVIAAPRQMIEHVIAKHVLVANLLSGAWLHLVAIEAGDIYRFGEDGIWERVNVVQAASRTGL